MTMRTDQFPLWCLQREKFAPGTPRFNLATYLDCRSRAFGNYVDEIGSICTQISDSRSLIGTLRVSDLQAVLRAASVQEYIEFQNWQADAWADEDIRKNG